VGLIALGRSGRADRHRDDPLHRQRVRAAEAGRTHPRPLGHRAGAHEGTVQRVRPKLMTMATDAGRAGSVALGTGRARKLMKRMAAPMVGGLIPARILRARDHSRRVHVLAAGALLWERLPELDAAGWCGCGAGPGRMERAGRFWRRRRSRPSTSICPRLRAGGVRGLGRRLIRALGAAYSGIARRRGGWCGLRRTLSYRDSAAEIALVS